MTGVQTCALPILYLPLIPASTSRRVVSDSTNWQLPELPLAKEQNDKGILPSNSITFINSRLPAYERLHLILEQFDNMVALHQVQGQRQVSSRHLTYR